MTRWTLVAAAGIVLAAAGLIAAQHDEKHKAVRTLAVRDIAEKLDGKKAKATTVEVTLEPGQASAPHRHPGPVFGYVLEGEYDTFYEPTGCLHRVS
jgi:quercetin dioxygenase-like cupin family protein